MSGINTKKNISLWVTAFLVSSLFICFNADIPNASGQQNEIELTPLSSPTKLISTPVFSTADQSRVIVTPTFNDSTTNIAFYIKCPNVACPDIGTEISPIYLFSAENLGHGDLPFSEYWAPPADTDYVAIEYANDNQQFTCSDLSLTDCLADVHFLNVFYFTLVSSDTEITPQLLAAKAELNTGEKIVVTTATSTVSDALLSLSITLSSTSISSDLDNGLIVTASLDGVAGVSIAQASDAAATTSPETKDESSVGSFFQDIVDTVIDIFTPDKIAEEAAVITPTLNEPAVEVEAAAATETKPNEATPADDVQSAVTNEDKSDNEVTTTTF